MEPLYLFIFIHSTAHLTLGNRKWAKSVLPGAVTTTPEAAPGRIRRGEQGEARAGKRFKTWSKLDPSVALVQPPDNPCLYKGLRRPPVAGLCIHAQHVSDGVVKDGGKARCQAFEIYVCLCSQSSNIPK